MVGAANSVWILALSRVVVGLVKQTMAIDPKHDQLKHHNPIFAFIYQHLTLAVFFFYMVGLMRNI